MSQQKIRQKIATALAEKEIPFKCFVCEEELPNLFDWEVSHVQAKIEGGTLSFENVKVCCLPCNRDMGKHHLYAYILVFFPLHSQYYFLQNNVQHFQEVQQKMIQKDIEILSNRQKTKRLQKRLWLKQIGQRKFMGYCPCCGHNFSNPDINSLYIRKFGDDLDLHLLVCSSQCLLMKEPWRIFLKRCVKKIVHTTQYLRSNSLIFSNKRQKIEFRK